MPLTTHRALDHLTAITRRYPSISDAYQDFRRSRGRGLPLWPAWCYCPLAAAYAVVSGGGDNRVPLDRADDISRVGALAAWRATKGIYRFDSDLGRALVETPLDGDLPVDVLYRLPEWCVYVETTGLVPGLHGAFVHLEWDAGDGRTELRLLLDDDKGLTPVPLHVGAGGLVDAVQAFADEAASQAAMHAVPFAAVLPRAEVRQIADLIRPVVALALYLCSEEPDYAGDARPRNPVVEQTRKGPREKAAQAPTTWEVGIRIGAALRAARREESGEGEGTHAGPRPHVRRAHWHVYWTGPKTEAQKPVLRWLSPMLVGAGERPAVVRPVKS